MSAKKLSVVDEATQDETESPDLAPPGTTFVTILGREYPMRSTKGLTWDERMRWSTLVDELQSIQPAMAAFNESYTEDEDDWAEVPTPPAELVKRFARCYKRICRFAYPSVPMGAWRELDTPESDTLSRLADQFVIAMRRENDADAPDPTTPQS